MIESNIFIYVSEYAQIKAKMKFEEKKNNTMSLNIARRFWFAFEP